MPRYALPLIALLTLLLVSRPGDGLAPALAAVPAPAGPAERDTDAVAPDGDASYERVEVTTLVDPSVVADFLERLGAVIEAGSAAAHTGIPGDIGGETARRLLRSPTNGVFERVLDLGDLVARGEIVAMVAGEPVRAGLDGMVRGLLLSGHAVPKGKKVGDVDPRGAAAPLLEPSDKAAAVGAGVLAALRMAEARRPA